MDEMDEMDEKLLTKIREQMVGVKASLRDWDVASVCAPGWRNSIARLKQPAEIWEPFLLRMATRPVADFRAAVEVAAQKCESPIEELFFLALVTVAADHSESLPLLEPGEPEPFSIWGQSSVVPQVPVGKYRMDFIVTGWDIDLGAETDKGRELLWKKGIVLVEVDGHEFHEKTKEQASHDKKKDRDLQTAGFIILRYTGSDVWNRCMACADEVLRAARKLAADSAPLAVEIDEPKVWP